MVSSKHTTAPRCYLRFPACSLAVRFLVRRPTHHLALGGNWHLFSKFTCTCTSTVLVGAARGLCLCCHCESKAFFKIIDYFFSGSFIQFLLQSIEAERFYIRVKSKETVGNSWTVLFRVTNIITIIKWDPYLLITGKIRNKRWFFSSSDFFFVSSIRRMLPFDVWPSFPVTTWTLPYADFGKTIVLTTQHSQIANFFRTFSVVFNCRSLFNEATYLAALCRLRSPFCNPWRQLETIKDKNIWKNSPFVADFGCNR